MRTIRKYGGFDNYILLAPEKRMQSIYGEYLRELMLRRLADPSFQVKYG
jgi:large subunit ribosomal protein L28